MLFFFGGVEVTSALAVVLDVQLRGCAADAHSALELVGDALQEMRKPKVTLFIVIFRSLWVCYVDFHFLSFSTRVSKEGGKAAKSCCIVF
jgi:hypothetical protein